MISEQLQTLSATLGEKLKQKNWQITCAESCTGGGIGYAITSAAGSSNWFRRGFITYSNDAKTDLVGVSLEALQEFGAVSEEVVQQMVTGALKQALADVSVAVSGIAGPGGGSQHKPVGLVWFGFIIGGDTFTEKRFFTGDRNQVRDKTIQHALQTIVDKI